jgi:hypothetical protein
VSTDALRAFRRLFPESEIIHAPSTDVSLYGGAYSDPPTVRKAVVVEGQTLRAFRVDGDPCVTFA